MDVRPGYKQTDVGLIPEDWEASDLSHLCTLQRGFDITEATRMPGTVPVYSSSGLSYFHDKAMVNPPGVVTGRKGILGKVFLISEPFWPHDTTLWVKDFRGNHPAYVALVLRNFHLERLDAATSVPTLNRNNLAGHLVPLPPTKAEQEAIAEALSDADVLIESLEQLLAKKRQLKQGTMQELLTGKKRLPGFSGEWEVKRLGDVVEIQKGELITEKNAVPGAIPVIAGGKKPAYFHNCANRSGKTITISGSGANAGYIAFYDTPIFASDCSTIGEGPNYSVEFVYYALLLKQGAIYKAQTGGAQPHIHPSDLCPLLVSVPGTKAEQTAIAAILSDMDAEIAALETKVAKARQLKQGMMQELLTGRIRLI